MDHQGIDDNGKIYDGPQHLWERAAKGGDDMPQWYTAAGAQPQGHSSPVWAAGKPHSACSWGLLAHNPTRAPLRPQSTTGTSKKLPTTACWAGMATCRDPTCATAAPSCARCGRGASGRAGGLLLRGVQHSPTLAHSPTDP